MILSLMDQHSDKLDRVFLALADPTRRAVIGRLGRGEASVGELAKPFDIALPSFMKHIHMLEACGLIETRKAGRVRTCALEPGRFAMVDGWLAEQREIWEARTDRMEAFVMTREAER